MSELYAIADLHLGHKKIAIHRGFDSVEEHDTDIIRVLNWVAPEDTIWVLGDVAFSDKALKRLADVRCTLKLVAGNHDLSPSKDYLKYFKRIAGCKEHGGSILTHIPVHPSQLEPQFGRPSRYEFNVHGHLHERKVNDDRYICVSVEQVQVPVHLNTLIESHRSRIQASP